MKAEDYIAQELAGGRLTYAHIAELTRNFQRECSLAVDGMPGPTTRAALDALLNPPAPPLDRVATAGLKAVEAARKLWQMNVYDPPVADASARGIACKAVISALMHDTGWGGPYKGDPTFQWCGIFVGKCWQDAGMDPHLVTNFLASTYRLGQFASYRPFNSVSSYPKGSGAKRQVARLDSGSTTLPFAPQAGDILTIGDGNPAEGDHICLVESYDEKLRIFHTFEGNGSGLGPDGKYRQGIVRGERHLGGTGYCARMLIRVGEGDLL